LINLISNRDYSYKVRASDKTLNNDFSIKYENITDFSNVIQIKTMEDKSAKNKLISVVNSDGSVTVIMPSTDVKLNIYNILGQLIRSVNSTYNIMIINDLPRSQAYILQAGNKRSKIVL